MVLKWDKKEILQYVLIYFTIATGGSAWGSFLGNNLFIFLTFATGVAYLVFSQKGKIEKHFGSMLILCTIFCLMAMTYSSLSIGTYMNFMGKVLLTYAAINIDRPNFVKRFIRFSYVMAGISCVVYVFSQVVGFNTLAPLYTKLYTNPADGSYYLGNGYGLLLYRFVPLHSYRNCGMFTEPGEYAIFLIVALYFLIAYGDSFCERERNRIFLVLSIAMLTTQSTSGYIMFLIALIIAFISNGIPILHSPKLWATAIAAMIVFSRTIFEMLQNAVFQKIIVDGSINLNQGSAAARTGSIQSILRYIADKPSSLFGMGYEEIQSVGLGSCAGLLTNLLAIGIFAFLTFFGYLLVQGWQSRRSNLMFVLAVLILTLSGLSQPGTGFAVVYLMFYSGQKNRITASLDQER